MNHFDFDNAGKISLSVIFFSSIFAEFRTKNTIVGGLLKLFGIWRAKFLRVK